MFSRPRPVVHWSVWSAAGTKGSGTVTVRVKSLKKYTIFVEESWSKKYSNTRLSNFHDTLGPCVFFIDATLRKKMWDLLTLRVESGIYRVNLTL